MSAPAPKMSEGAHHSDPPEEADGPATVAPPAAPSRHRSEMKTLREVTRKECPWLADTVDAGTTVYRFRQPTYGVVGPDGLAVTFDPLGDYPFFELPYDALVEAS